MLYCPPNVTFDHIWINHGISHCFLDTVTATVYAAFILIFGIGQWVMYRKYATVTDQYLRPKSVLFGLQVALTVLMLLIAIARLVLQATVIGDHVLYGYMIVYFCCNVLCWPLSLRIVFLERNYLLPTVPTRGHGVVLLVFWTLVFVSENLAFLNLRNEDWWFDLSTLTDKMEFVLFLLRYISGCLLFILGLKSPGISTLRDYVNFGGSVNDQEENFLDNCIDELFGPEHAYGPRYSASSTARSNVIVEHADQACFVQVEALPAPQASTWTTT